MRKRLNDKEKVYIINSYNKDKLKDISQKLNRPIITIQKFYKRWTERGVISNRKSFNRPKLRNINAVVVSEYLRKNPESKLKDIIKDLNLNCCSLTLSRFLKKMKFSYSNVKVKPKLTEKHIEERLNFALEYQKWTVDDWKNAIFADESSVEIGKRYRKKTWSQRGSERFDFQKKRYCIKYLKVWSFISFDEIGDITFINDKWNSDTYIEILENSVVFSKTNNKILYHDRDTSHKSSKTRKFLEENGIKHVYLPPNSPDINPIENMLFYWKKKIEKERIFTKEGLIQRSNLIWKSISKEYIEALISSLPNRISNIINNKGKITKY